MHQEDDQEPVEVQERPVLGVPGAQLSDGQLLAGHHESGTVKNIVGKKACA